MLFVPAPVVMIPLLIVHTYLLPETLAAEAVFPIEAEHTNHEVLMAGFGHGRGVIGIVKIPLETGPQPVGPVTETDKDTEPVDPPVYVMLFVPAPAVMVPFVIVHAYMAPDPALLTEAILPIETAVTMEAVEMLALGRAFTVTCTD